jgi:hypothetical protein
MDTASNFITMDFLRAHISSSPEIFGLEMPVRGDDIHFVISTPVERSKAGRIHYKIYIGHREVPALYAQAVPNSAADPMLNDHPYRPIWEEIRRDLADVLPSPSGKIICGPQVIYWAKFIPWRSLMTYSGSTGIKTEPYTKLAERLRRSPWNKIIDPVQLPQLISDLKSEYFTMIQQVCEMLEELAPHQSRLNSLLENSWDQIKFGFSHGDLWCNDVLMSENFEICILDWEWAGLARPAGIDLFHFAVSMLENHYRISPEVSLTALIWGTGSLEKIFRQQLHSLWIELGYKDDARRLSIFLYLIYIQYRRTLQMDISFSDMEYGRAGALAMAISSPDYLTPLIVAR